MQQKMGAKGKRRSVPKRDHIKALSANRLLWHGAQPWLTKALNQYLF
jgi:hypothetical protein